MLTLRPVRTVMNEHQKETAFLRHIIRYDDTVARHRLEEKMIEVERNERSMRRAVYLMGGLTALALAGLGYSIVFLESFPESKSQLILKIFGGLGLAAVLCLPGFIIFWIIHRRSLDEQREVCRRLITKLLEARLGAPHPPHRAKAVVPGLESGSVASASDSGQVIG